MLKYVDTYLQTNILTMFQCHFMHLVLGNVTSSLAKDNQSQAASMLTLLNIHELCTDAETFKLFDLRSPFFHG